VADGPLPLASYNYDLAGNRTSKTLENGTSTAYSYDDASRLTAVDHLVGAASFQRIDYALNNVGNRTARTETNAGTGATADSYSYDPAEQVTGVAYATGRTVSYAYDATGNRTSVVEDADGSGSAMTTPYTTNALNQYTAIDGFVPPLYDSNGNLTRVQTSATTPIWTYAYDAQNRLVSGSATDGTTFTFAYDAKNRCIARTINGTTTLYIFDDWNLTDERNAADTQQAKYIHGPAIDEMLVRTTPTGTAYYHQDGLGSTTALTNATGALLESYRYDVFGAPTFLDATGTAAPSSPISNRFLFTGGEYLPELALHDYRNRIYSLTLGRFIQIDPIRFAAEDVNLYRYVDNQPINFVDPNGEAILIPIVSGILVVALAVQAIEPYLTDPDMIEPVPCPKPGRNGGGPPGSSSGGGSGGDGGDPPPRRPGPPGFSGSDAKFPPSTSNSRGSSRSGSKSSGNSTPVRPVPVR
jgi:RHS repeat-associated protein